MNRITACLPLHPELGITHAAGILEAVFSRGPNLDYKRPKGFHCHMRQLSEVHLPLYIINRNFLF